MTKDNKISIRYKGVSLENWISITDLWTQLISFSTLSKTIFKEVWKIDIKELELKITGLKEWSIVVDLIVNNLWDIVSRFKNVHDFLNYLHTLDIEIYKKAVDIINASVNSYKELENRGKDHPVALLIAAEILLKYKGNLSRFLKKIFRISKEIKNTNLQAVNDDAEIDINGIMIKWKIAKNTKKIVNQWKFVDLLEPIIDDKVTEIDVWFDDDFEEIDSNNFENMIGEGFEILPEYRNWEEYEFIWSFTAMQSNIGETMTLKSNTLVAKNWKNFLFSCITLDEHTTEEYKEFYWESILVKVKAEILRSSLYKKPKLIVKSVVRMNPSLIAE